MYTSPYIFGIKTLQKALLVSTLLLNILEAKSVFSTPKKKGKLSATVI